MLGGVAAGLAAHLGLPVAAGAPGPGAAGAARRGRGAAVRVLVGHGAQRRPARGRRRGTARRRQPARAAAAPARAPPAADRDRARRAAARRGRRAGRGPQRCGPRRLLGAPGAHRAGRPRAGLEPARRGRAASRAAPAGGPRSACCGCSGGTALAGTGVFLLVGRDAPLEDLVRSALAALAVLVGAALVLAPWWLRLVRELSDERAGPGQGLRARRHRRPPARLGAADPGPDPGEGGERRRGRQARPRPGARAALVAVRRPGHARDVGRRRAARRGRRGRGPPRGARRGRRGRGPHAVRAHRRAAPRDP